MNERSTGDKHADILERCEVDPSSEMSSWGVSWGGGGGGGGGGVVSCIPIGNNWERNLLGTGLKNAKNSQVPNCSQ